MVKYYIYRSMKYTTLSFLVALLSLIPAVSKAASPGGYVLLEWVDDTGARHAYKEAIREVLPLQEVRFGLSGREVKVKTDYATYKIGFMRSIQQSDLQDALSKRGASLNLSTTCLQLKTTDKSVMKDGKKFLVGEMKINCGEVNFFSNSEEYTTSANWMNEHGSSFVEQPIPAQPITTLVTPLPPIKVERGPYI